MSDDDCGLEVREETEVVKVRLGMPRLHRFTQPAKLRVILFRDGEQTVSADVDIDPQRLMRVGTIEASAAHGGRAIERELHRFTEDSCYGVSG